MGSVRNITAIALQGRPHSVEYVTEFTISYGYNGLDYADFKEPGGNIKVNERSFDEMNKTNLKKESKTLLKRITDQLNSTAKQTKVFEQKQN